jgi:actin-related protein 4
VFPGCNLDEVSAIVLDPGYSTTRAGFAGEDAPKSVIPTYYGKYSHEGQERLLFGDSMFVQPRAGISVHNPIGKDGIVEDWDMAEKVWESSFASRLTATKPGNPFHNGLNDIPSEEFPAEMEVETDEKPLADNPLLMSEPGWNPAKAREKTIEIAMEKWGTPAFYLARNGVLAAYVLPRFVHLQASNSESLSLDELSPSIQSANSTIVSLPARPPHSSLISVPPTSPSPQSTMA